MQRLPMASSPDGLISARDAVITKTPGGEVLTAGGGRGAGQQKRTLVEAKPVGAMIRPTTSTLCPPV